MQEISVQNEMPKQIKLLRKYLKFKIIEDNVSFRNHTEQREHVYDLVKRTVCGGESHSALMIGPRGSGKTTLINSVLHQLSKELDLDNDAIIVKLNGLIHNDEKLSLRSITAQMQLENAVGDRVFGTFAENLAFLLSCLQTGADRRCKSMVFILEEFDVFCKGGRTQTLLYNLFDITHSEQSPMCVLGVTNRLDVMELLEKRVKSRFSHRHILIFPEHTVKSFKLIMRELLTVPSVGNKRKRGRKSEAPSEKEDIPSTVLNRCKTTSLYKDIETSFIQYWNAHIDSLLEDERIIDAVEKFSYYTVNEQIFRNILFQLVSKISSSKPYIDATDFITIIDNTVAPEHRVKLLQSLSILELSLVIAMKHGLEIFDGQPMNFEMVLHRYTKFAQTNSSTQTVPRPVILKAFEHLQSLEIILPIRTTDNIYNVSETTASRVQKEYKLFTLAIPVDEINDAVKNFRNLPTEISHWYNNSVV